MGVCFGWGPENDYVSDCNQHGLYVHASDYNKNLPALSNVLFASEPSPRPPRKPAPQAAPKPVHTVSFVMTDGDNLQWTYGPWAWSSQWFGAPYRGTVPMGWTFSPATAFLAKPILDVVLGKLSTNDELVAGPSGVGYMYPSTWQPSLLSQFNAATEEGMRAAGMSAANVLGQNDDAPMDRELRPLLASDQVKAMFYYPWGDGYSAFKGRLSWLDDKPVISGRFTLWGNGTTGEMLGVPGMIAALTAMPRTPHLPEGYSLVPVHAWSHSYDDVVEVVRALRAHGGIDVVLPSELIRRVVANVNRSSDPLCTCDQPGAGTLEGEREFTCTDDSRGRCTDNQVCFSDRPVWPAVQGCKELHPLSCTCLTPLAGTAGHNEYSCTDGSRNRCPEDHECYALAFAKASLRDGCRVPRSPNPNHEPRL